MRNKYAVLCLALLMATAPGCGLIQSILSATRTNVRLVNNADFPVDVEIFTSDDEDVVEPVLATLGTKLEFTLAAGETMSFSKPCADLHAIVVENAKLHVLGDTGPETHSNIIRSTTDFNCGDTIVFTFDHSAIITDFNVTTTIE